MTRSVLLLVGGALVLSAVGIFMLRPTRTENLFGTRSVHSDEVAAGGVFIPNLGQVASDAFFYLKRDRSTILLRATSIDFEVQPSSDGPGHVGLHFVAASRSPKVMGLKPLTGVTGFRAVKYQGLYRGIDLRIEAAAERLSVAFILAPGADPGLILFKADGLDEGLVGTPKAYQAKDGLRTPVSVSFEPGRYGSTLLALGPYDVDVPIRIDFEIRF